MITDQIKQSIDSSVLCWLATISDDGFPSVSPKEAFLYDKDGKLLIANIASPKSMENIKANRNVCVSLINVFTQKGYKVYGLAEIIEPSNVRFAKSKEALVKRIGATFEILSAIEIEPTKVEPIIAPSYRLFPETTEAVKIKESLETYKVHEYQQRNSPACR